MDDGGKQQHLFGNGQQRSQHPRPFFYVQPPSQPYYLYQHWQMNNPYSHYGLPGGFNYGRPYMHPYQYMQYPGYVFPPAPIYPMDYRRMFDSRFHAPFWGDVPRQQQHFQPQGRRDVACSEVQTDPSDAITKLMECLDKIRASELQAADRELDSGVASQASGMFCPEEEKKRDEQGAAPEGSHLDSPPSKTLLNSTAAEYDGETSTRRSELLNAQECWSALEEELPLDSSSVHECPELEHPAGDECLPLRREAATGVQSDSLVTDQCVPRGDVEELQRPTPPHAAFSSSRGGDGLPSKAERQTASAHEAKCESSYRILRLPHDSVLPPGASGLSSPAPPYCYNYLSLQTTHERMSVLSPSLDELSSRDEMFSTDLEDVDLFPKRVYAGRRPPEAAGASPQAACTCCGKSLAKGTSRGKVHSSKAYRDEADSEDEGRYGRAGERPLRVVVRKHPAPRKPHCVPQRQPARAYRRGQYKDPSGGPEQEEALDFCPQEAAEDEGLDAAGGELHCRTGHDGVCREDLTGDQGRWGERDAAHRRRLAASLQQDVSSQRKVMYHRARDDDNDEDEEPSLWERGSAMRGEPRR
ncbi:bucky ball [Betta splendens]|uniref:Bucky ball n=1 Tax=Betta splendens TaxID=158456 RepID=A0A6P7MGR2_BETSP|nr:bucky ball [Betta splendens]